MMMNSGCISWKSKLLTVVANSTTDAEVYAATLAIKEIIYLRDALRRIGLPQATKHEPRKGTVLYEDNEACTAIARTAAHCEATKHMAIARSFLRYHHENGTVFIQDCYTHMQVADFLMKPLGAQIHDKLIHLAMGKEPQTGIEKFSRRMWQDLYQEKIQAEEELRANSRSEQQSKKTEAELSSEKQSENTEVDIDTYVDTPNDAQGGMLKCMYIDVAYLNVMRIDTHHEGPNYLMCDSIEEYLRFEQHRSYLAQRVTEEDLSVEARYYGNVVQLHRIVTE
jgi:hypothetical protein